MAFFALLAAGTALAPAPILRNVQWKSFAVQHRQNYVPIMMSRASSAAATTASIKEQLAAVRELRPVEQSAAVQRSLWAAAGLIPAFKVSGLYTGEPSFTQLFSHETWTKYTGVAPIRRWLRALTTWRFSTVLASVWPICIGAAAWAYGVASIPAKFLPRASPVPLTLMGSAIGLLLVFRVNNLYGRVAEARLLWGRAVFLCRQAAQTTATSLLFDEGLPETLAPSAHASAEMIGRYLAAFPWELSAKLTGKGDGVGKTRDLKPGEDLDILEALLPPAEAAWIGQARSRPLLLLGAIRRVLTRELRAGSLPSVVYRKLDEDLKELDLVVGGCERLFSSPVPPTMSRHAMRSQILWFLAMPFGLASSFAPWNLAAWAFLVSYIFVGIEEVGAQVEQPFEITPMTRLCVVIMYNLDEAFSAPPALEAA